MRISEYTLLEGAFDNSFGFMLNRINDALEAGGHPPLPEALHHDDYLRDRAFSEFIIALEEMGVVLDEAVVVKEKNNAEGA